MEYRVVATDIEFAEGPLELPDGDILFTEIRAGTLTRVSPDGSRREPFATTGGGPNGAAIGPDGAIYVTQNGGFQWSESRTSSGQRMISPGPRPEDGGYIGGQIQRVSPDGSEVTTVYSECDGEPLKGPNDLVFDREGNF
ncbi:MAG: SMP-30/gluconolactonase/LRE family protein, partial [Dehalococcoidia bacterium]|nr:SMP-30/gluconolactonase/LRE family protein [Dehalococcoidia bacterium]